MHVLSIIGCGNMGEAILQGVLDSAVLDKSGIAVFERDQGRREYIQKKYSVSVYDRFGDIRLGQYVLMAVKPQDLPEVINALASKELEEKRLISIVAGVPSTYFEKKLGKIRVIRVMPNTCALVKKGVFAVSRGTYARKEDVAFTDKILSNLGQVVFVGETLQNLATALSGSGPAYFFLFCKYMIEAAAGEGMDDDTAKKLVAETMAGSAEVMKKSGKDLDVLIDMVASPGGTTERALAMFKKCGLSDTVKAAVMAAEKRAFELEKLLDP